MNKESLKDFTEDQLQHYLLTAKQRVKEMRQLTVQLEHDNGELAHQYSELILKKRLLAEQVRKQKSLIQKWYDDGKKSVHDWVNLLRREDNREHQHPNPNNFLPNKPNHEGPVGSPFRAEKDLNRKLGRDEHSNNKQ